MGWGWGDFAVQTLFCEACFLEFLWIFAPLSVQFFDIQQFCWSSFFFLSFIYLFSILCPLPLYLQPFFQSPFLCSASVILLSNQLTLVSHCKQLIICFSIFTTVLAHACLC